jgi:hypothetical protein
MCREIVLLVSGNTLKKCVPIVQNAIIYLCSHCSAARPQGAAIWAGQLAAPAATTLVSSWLLQPNQPSHAPAAPGDTTLSRPIYAVPHGIHVHSFVGRRAAAGTSSKSGRVPLASLGRTPLARRPSASWGGGWKGLWLPELWDHTAIGAGPCSRRASHAAPDPAGGRWSERGGATRARMWSAPAPQGQHAGAGG